MAKRPSFQFYPADWRGDAKLGRCTRSSRSAWIDILGVLHDSEEYGVARWPLADLARAAGVPVRLAQELVSKNVLKGDEKNASAYIFTPFHAGQHGEPVTLVPTKQGEPCWYSSRFVRDEWVRQRRGAASRFDTENQPEKASPKATIGAHIGERQGDGSSSSTSSSKERTLSREYNPSISSDRKKRAPLADEPDGFNEFYQAFPKRVARRAAAKAYRAALTRASPDAVLAGACRYATATIGKDREHVAHPSTWLNADRWLDEVQPVVSQTSNGHHKNGTPTAPDNPHSRFLRAAAAIIAETESRAAEDQHIDPNAGPTGDPLLPP